MDPNPYIYLKPLTPERDTRVCIPRKTILKKVVTGIRNGDYWSIMGANHIGKTTFLHLIQHEFPEAFYIYVNFKANQLEKKLLYQWLANTCLESIPSAKESSSSYTQGIISEFEFQNFLYKFKPIDPHRRIVFLFDTIENAPDCNSFLHFWRTIYHDRFYKNSLNRYNVIATGSVDLIALTVGSTSPFNIAQKMYLTDFTQEECGQLIDKPFAQLGITIDQNARKKLLDTISGHPQLLQHACHLLVEKAGTSNQKITETNVDEVITVLLEDNLSMNALKTQLKGNRKLQNLLRDIFNGAEKKFHPFKNFASEGAGPIIQKGKHCDIRN